MHQPKQQGTHYPLHRPGGRAPTEGYPASFAEEPGPPGDCAVQCILKTPHQRKSPAAGAGHAGDDALGNLPHNPCGCEIAVQKGSNPSDTAPPAVGCAVRTKEKILRRCTFPRCSRTTRRYSPAWRRRPPPAGPSRSVRPRPWRSSRNRRKPTCRASNTTGCKGPWPGAADRPSRSRLCRHSYS